MDDGCLPGGGYPSGRRASVCAFACLSMQSPVADMQSPDRDACRCAVTRSPWEGATAPLRGGVWLYRAKLRAESQAAPALVSNMTPRLGVISPSGASIVCSPGSFPTRTPAAPLDPPGAARLKHRLQHSPDVSMRGRRTNVLGKLSTEHPRTVSRQIASPRVRRARVPRPLRGLAEANRPIAARRSVLTARDLRLQASARHI